MAGRPEQAHRERLQALLITRRVELNSAWVNRRVFADDVSELLGARVSYRVITDIETGARTNFNSSTLALLEQAYGWTAGSINRVLAGENPTPTDGPGATPEPAPEPVAAIPRPADYPPDGPDHQGCYKLWLIEELPIHFRRVCVYLWAGQMQAPAGEVGETGDPRSA